MSEAASHNTPPAEEDRGGRPDRLIAYKPHDLSGKWRAQKIRYGSYAIQVELPCINGLSAWFSIGYISEADEAERMMTDGARLEARDYAEAIAALLSSPRVEGETLRGELAAAMMLEAADVINRLIRERDEARRKALEEAAGIADQPYSDAVMALGTDEPFAVGRKIAEAIRSLSPQGE